MKKVLIKFLFGLFILFFSFIFIVAINLGIVSFFYTDTLTGKIIGLLLFVGTFWGVCWLGEIVLDSVELTTTKGGDNNARQKTNR